MYIMATRKDKGSGFSHKSVRSRNIERNRRINWWRYSNYMRKKKAKSEKNAEKRRAKEVRQLTQDAAFVLVAILFFSIIIGAALWSS